MLHLYDYSVFSYLKYNCLVVCSSIVSSSGNFKKKYVVIQNVKVIPSSNLRPRWQTMEVRRGVPQNESEAVEYLQKRSFFALSKVSFLKLSKTVTEYEFITKYSTKLIMNETKFIMFLKVIFPGRSKYKNFHLGD